MSGRKLTWSPPKIEDVCNAIISNGKKCVLQLEKAKSCKSPILLLIMRQLKFCGNNAQLTWLLRAWKQNMPNLRQEVMLQLR